MRNSNVNSISVLIFTANSLSKMKFLGLIIASMALSVQAIPNPASTHCITKSGKEIQLQTSTGVYSLCQFQTGKVCEEWAFFRNDCDKPSAVCLDQYLIDHPQDQMLSSTIPYVVPGCSSSSQ
eukprot:TRINITY_DN13685_c0_g1::TRINITY_DN13685_c0_g1_i1::g.16772::m.16772 TRINITY_DN13685_c0_g1::TRINITY_DN13685_c0_g1_i1::g.16772  ORF type:complete len:123 (-),score=7.00,sp/P64495/YOAF_SHIFL/43.18/3e-06,DUF333/PF03891.10/1.3e-14 TRINITY_DN13685_c0_g1_i1:20-388(-)